jgi:hypothetical protein
MKTKYDRINSIIAFEQGDLGDEGVLELFSDLIKTGMAWSLQGFYGRTAASLIEAGYIGKDGTILRGIS